MTFLPAIADMEAEKAEGRRNAQPESELQKKIVPYLRKRGFYVVHVPNGSKLAGTKRQRAMRGARLKAEGTVPGFPDLLVYAAGGRVGHIEVKAEGNYQQPTQKACQLELQRLGHLYAVCRSMADVDETLQRWGWL
jgi:hypothetical protein